MAYILFVNPITLALDSVKDFPEALRIDQGAVFTATALASAKRLYLNGINSEISDCHCAGYGAERVFCVFCCPWYGYFMAGKLCPVFLFQVLFSLLFL